MSTIISFDKPAAATNEAEVEAHAKLVLEQHGFRVTMRKCDQPALNRHWPSKTQSKTGKGFPDLLLYAGPKKDILVCVWENKPPTESSDAALEEAKFYVDGLRSALPVHPGIPRFAVGYNGRQLRLAFLDNFSNWRPVLDGGEEVRGKFLQPDALLNSVNASGELVSRLGKATAGELRRLLPALRTLYRTIPRLASGRAPIDFTIALLTLKLVLETKPEWGSWSELPRLGSGAMTPDHDIAERFMQFAKRTIQDVDLKGRYGDIFHFREQGEGAEEAFDFINVIDGIKKGRGHFEKLHRLLDDLPPLHGADFDVFGEVYQALGDEATKKKLGEFFTGRHIIAAVLPILFERAGYLGSLAQLRTKKLADIACGTGGFLTEMLRLVRLSFKLDEKQIRTFAQHAFYGYDLSTANASRARVNMYFAGDGFSEIQGACDSLHEPKLSKPSFDLIATNPPYGQYHGGRIEEAFLRRVLVLLKPGTGWGCVVLPTGTLENPRSEGVRFDLLRQAQITDIIALPKHAFAPYTQQRTALVLFKRRRNPIEAESCDWSQIRAAAGEEEISFFIVDNDGFANSDKRYPTDRKAANGAWLHDDLRPWADKRGLRQPSKLWQALIERRAPKNCVDEIGEALPSKYVRLKVKSLVQQWMERSVPLLPDVFLRSTLVPMSASEWCDQVEALANSVKSFQHTGTSLKEAAERLLSQQIHVTGAGSAISIENLFEVTKGDQRLTEAAIYQSLTVEEGLPVYGGGAKGPRFQVAKPLVRTDGSPATVFEGPALLVAMDGSSGAIQVIERGEFYCNHHGAVLTPKARNLNLWCVAQLTEPRLRALASNQEGSATLTTGNLTALRVGVPKGVLASRIGKARKTLSAIHRMAA